MKEKIEVLSDFKKFIELNLVPYISAALIHGSIATKDYTNYSDLDTLFILKKEAVLDSEVLYEAHLKFIELNKFLLLFDPLQHHGHFFITEYDLDSYSQTFLPVASLSHAKLIFPNQSCLTIYVRDSGGNFSEAENKLLPFLEKVRRVYVDPRERPKNTYQTKLLLSQFMLLPALYLQTQGKYVCKKQSFGIAKEDFRQEWGVMEKISQFRHEWMHSDFKVHSNLLKLFHNPWAATFVCNKIDFKMSDWLSQNMTEELYKEMFKLSESIKERVFGWM